jgi:hypothetical protein
MVIPLLDNKGVLKKQPFIMESCEANSEQQKKVQKPVRQTNASRQSNAVKTKHYA